VSIDAEVGIELTVAHRDGRTRVISVRGESHEEAKGGAGTDAMAAGLETALQGCVQSFLADPQLAELLATGPATAGGPSAGGGR
jgi:hypothetical protein